jgi:hypothetical protein
MGIIGWPTDPSDAENTFGGEIERCLTTRILEVAPEIVVVPQRTVRDALFPLLESTTQPATEESFAALLARDDVRARLLRRDMRYLVTFTGGTNKKPGGAILCGAGYGGGGCLGFSWQDETTVLDAALWPLDDGTAIQHEGANIKGTSLIPAFLLPIPIPARTKAMACHELGTRIAVSIRKMAVEHDGNR